MQEISKEKYVKNISDYEKLCLIIVEEDKIFLRADIQTEENLQIEMMKFEMNTSLNFTNSNSDSRNCGGKIYFFETDSDNVIKDFLDIDRDAIYLICNEDDLKNILPTYKNKSLYVLTK